MTFLNVPSEQKYKRNQNPGWTTERIEDLRAYCGEGLSASQIAHKLGFATRNAVIGKIHRLGLIKGHQSPPLRQRAPGSGIKPQNVCPQVIEKAHYTRKRRLRISLVETTAPTQPLYIQSSEYDQGIPHQKHRPDCCRNLLQLGNHTCHWPVGDPQKPDFFFCGAWTNEIYCRHHAARAYRA